MITEISSTYISKPSNFHNGSRTGTLLVDGDSPGLTVISSRDNERRQEQQEPQRHQHLLLLEKKLQACREASTSHDHDISWKRLIDAILSVNDMKISAQYGRKILLEFPYHSSTYYSEHMYQFLEIGCGKVITITTCCSLLRDLAEVSSPTSQNQSMRYSNDKIDQNPELKSNSTNTITKTHKSKLDSPLPETEILQACWSILQRLILSDQPQRTTSNTKREEDDTMIKISNTSTTTTTTTTTKSTTTMTRDYFDRNMIQLLLTIPSLMANACHVCQRKLPLLATPAKFFPRLVECSGNRKCDEEYSYQIPLLHGMLATRIKSADAIALGLAQQHPLSFGITASTGPVTPDRTMMMDVRPWTGRELGHLILAFLQHYVASSTSSSTTASITIEAEASSSSKLYRIPSQDDILLSCERLLKPSSTECQSLVVHFWVCQTPHVVDSRLCPLMVSLWQKCDCLHSSLHDIAEHWSDWSYCQEVSTHKQHFVSQLLLEGLKQLDEDEMKDEANELITDLLQGVTHRLESFVSEIRLDGMRIAKQIARLVQQELHFDELEEAEKNEQKARNIPPVVPSPPEVETPTHFTHKEKKTKRKPKKTVDPDADFDSDADDDDDDDNECEQTSDDSDASSASFDDELVPYSLDDDEDDLLETAKPLHLLRALELLRTGENDEHAASNHKTALGSLPDLVRKRPDDLPDVAISLVLQLIRMEDKFGTVNFLTSRQQSMVALCVMEPIIVGKQLTEEAFKEYPLADKLTCFGTLQQAAYELSGSMALDHPTTVGGGGNRMTALENETVMDVTASTSSIETESTTTQVARLQSKTRRKRSPRMTESTIIQNKFTPVAPMWFYSILGQFLKEKENEAMWSGSTGSHLLCTMLKTMAVIVEFAGLASAPILSRDLIELASSFLGADVTEVRLAVLIAISTSISVLPEDRILSILFERGDSMIRTIANLAKTDPDHNCRALASSLSHSFVDATRQYSMLT